MRLFFGVISLLALSACSVGGFQFKNDVFGGTDENFTNGIVVSYTNTNLTDTEKKIADYIPTGDKPLQALVYSIRQDMYTPDDLKSKEIVYDDNPYAGSLTLGLKKVVADPKTRYTTEIRAGTSGPPSLAGKTQIFVHDSLTAMGRKQTHPEGWDNQIEAEPLLNVDHVRTWENFRKSYGKFQLVNVSQLAAGAGSILTGAQFDYGYLVGYNVPELDRSNVKENVGAYLFLDGFGAATLHNLYYDGGLIRDSKHTVNSTLGNIGVDVGAGVEYNNYSVKFHYITRTRTFEEQQSSHHSFGFISLGVEW